MPPDRGSCDAPQDRVQRLEEALAFVQHDNEQLSAEVLSLGRRVGELLRRIEALERQSNASDALAKQDSDSPEDTDQDQASAG